MKKSVFKSGLVAAIAVVMMSCTTTANAQTGNTKYIYGQDGTNTTVYTLNEDGKTLTRKLKYEYKHDENGQVIEKKAYRWDAYRELWKPAYLLTVTPGVYETKLNYAEWNVKESAFNNNKQQSIYREDNNINLLADTQTRNNGSTNSKEQYNQPMANHQSVYWNVIGFVYPSIGLALGMLMGIVFGKLILVKIPLNTPLAQRAQQKSEIIFLLILFILFIEHWYVPCKQAIANLIN